MADWDELKSMVRAVCTCHKGGVSLQGFTRDYVTVVGQAVPFKKFGYPNLEALLRAMTDTVRVNKIGGDVMISEIPTMDTKHISDLVARQNKGKKAKVTVRKPFNRRTETRPVKKPQLVLQRTVTQQVPPKIANPLPTPTTYSDKKSHSFELPARFQNITRNAVTAPANGNSSHNNSYNNTFNNNAAKERPSKTPSPTDSISTSQSMKKKLQEYCSKHSLVLHPYKTGLFKMRKGTGFYCSSVMVGDHKYCTYPTESTNLKEAEELAAKIAFDELLSQDTAPVTPTNMHNLHSGENVALSRIIEIIGDRVAGVFNIGIEKEYRDIYNQNLPANWLTTIVGSSPALTIEKVDNKRSILYPVKKEPAQRKPSPEPEPAKVAEIKKESAEEVRKSSVSSECSTFSVSEVTPPTLNWPDEETFPVFVTRINSPKDIFVRLVKYSKEYDDLATDMEMYYMDKGKKASAVEVNQVYAAKVDGSWLRLGVQLLNSVHGHAQCIYLDHGEVDLIEISKLYVLEDQFRALPYQALRCQLYDVDKVVDDNNAYLHLMEMALGKAFIAQVMDREDPVSVILYDTSTDEDVNINEKLVVFTSKVKVCPELPKVGGLQEVYICHIDQDGKVFVNIESKFFNFLQEEIESAVIKAENNEGLVTVAEKNEMYLAKYEDESWYRAVVQEVDISKGSVQVEFIDYGNVETITLANLRDLNFISDTLTSLPAQALPCHLHSLPPEGYEWTDEAIAKLQQIAPCDTPLLLKVVGHKANNGPAIVELFKKVKPNDELVSVNTTLLVSMDLFKEAEITNDHSVEEDDVQIQIPLPEVPAVGQYFDVRVNLAASPTNFWCQPYSQVDDLDELMAEMQGYYGSNAKQMTLGKKKPSVGMFFAAKHSDDLWYRIYIQKVDESNPVSVCAYFIDYGNASPILVSSVLPLKQEFAKLPCMAINAKLHDISPINSRDWDPIHCFNFKQMVINKEFVSKIKDKSTDATSWGLPVPQIVVSLVDTSEVGKDVYIDRELIRAGIAKRKS